MYGDALRRGEASVAAVRSVFVNPDLRRIQLAWAGVSFATWAFVIALGVYAFGAGGAAAVGIAGLVRLAPGALASPFAGLLGDRHSRRDTLLASALLASVALLLAVLAVALGAPAGVVYALAGLFTVAISPYVPAEGALLPIVARTPQELSAANVAHSLADNVGFLVGSLIAGFLLAGPGVETAFGAAAGAGMLSALTLARVTRDQRPPYAAEGTEGVLRQTAQGFRAIASDPPLRLLGAALTVLVFFEGMADVLVVIVALDLLGLGEASVGGLSAAWGIGAVAGGAALTVLLSRGQLAAGLVAGSVIIGVATALPGGWAVPFAAYAAWAGMGVGYTFVEVAGRTLMQRLCADEVLARTLGSLETARLTAMALGSVAVPVLIGLFGIRGALIATAAVVPLFALLRWGRLRAFEAGSTVSELSYQLLRRNQIFEPLPVDSLERLTQDLQRVRVGAGKLIVEQGDPGRRFYLIESGEVEVIEDGIKRCTETTGEGFGEIALLRDCLRTATVRTTEPTVLLALEREQFVAAVTGNFRSRRQASELMDLRLGRSAGPAPAR